MIMLQLLDRSAVARALITIASEKAALRNTNVVELVKRNQPETNTRPITSPTLAVPWAGTKARSTQTTNTERKLADLESAVMDGLMTAREANRAFGRKPPGTRGRPRAPGQEDFRAWLTSRVERFSAPAAMGKLADRMMRVRQDRTLSHGKRAALMREINRQSWQCDPDYVDRLRGMLAELDEAPDPDDALAA